MPADGIFARPEFVGGPLRDDRDARSALAIAFVKGPAADDGNAHRAEVIAADPAIFDERRAVGRPGIAALDGHFPIPAELIHRQMARRADARHAADLPQLGQQRRVELAHAGVVLVARARWRDIEGYEVIAGEAG